MCGSLLNRPIRNKMPVQSVKRLHVRWKSWCEASVNRSIFGAALTVAILTLLVKIITVIKDIGVAGNYGVGDSLDAFLMAYLLPLFAISVFAGSFHSAFIPVLVNVREQYGQTEARRLFLNIALVALVMFIVVAIIFGVMDKWLMHLIASGFDGVKLNQTIILFDQMLPLIVVSGMALFGGAVLNTHKKFALAAIAPIFTPLLIVSGLYLMGNGDNPELLVQGTMIGAVLELLVIMWGLYKLDYLRRPQKLIWNAHSRKVINQYLPMISGAFIMSSTVLVDQIMASWLPSGSISALNYANKVPSFISGLAAAAIGTAVLPYLSKQAAEQSYSAMKHTLFTYSKIIILTSVPLMLLGIIFSYQIVGLLFQRKAFGASDTQLVSEILRYSLLQVPFYILGTLFARYTSLLRGNEFLLYGAIISLTLNITMNLILMRIIGVAGIALSTSIVYFAAAVFLFCISVTSLNEKLKNG